jgi:hypothetical protein
MAKPTSFTTPRSIAGITLISCDADPLTEEEIATIEDAIGPLPSDYRQFLLSSNGGRPVGEVHFAIGADDDRSLTAFSDLEAAFPPKVLTPSVYGAVYRLMKIAECFDSPNAIGSRGRWHDFLLDVYTRRLLGRRGSRARVFAGRRYANGTRTDVHGFRESLSYRRPR